VLPRPLPLYFEPPRLQRRKRVTIIAGFQCINGILICSDTEQSFLSSDSKSQTGKVPIFHTHRLTVAIGGAGDGALIDYITQDLVKHLLDKRYDWNSIESGINDYARKTFSRHIRPYAGFAASLVPEVSFLIAIAMEKQARLFKWEKNFAYLVPPMHHTSIGIGTLQSEQLLREIQFFYPSEQMLFFAVRMMQQVKQLVQGCGGKTEVAFLDVGSEIVVRHGIFFVDEVEHLTLMVDEFLTNHVLSFISNSQDLDKKSVDRTLDTLRQGIVNLRERYKKLVPETFLKVIKPSDKK
jgi:hypothetical protein